MSLSAFDRIAVVGATGAVGVEALSILRERGIPAERLVALASERSSGRTIAYGHEALTVSPTTPAAFEGVDLALFCATAGVAREFVPRAIGCGAVVVDNSSAFRADPRVPLIVPEVNRARLLGDRPAQLVANPNCSTILLLVAIEPLRRAWGISRLVVSTYQAVSGAGASAIDELKSQAGEVLAGRSAAPQVFTEPCAFNVFSHNSAVDPVTGLNVEEKKLIDETRRIWANPAVLISPTCVRVPVVRAHSESVTLTLDAPASEAEVRGAIASGEGIRIIDDRAGNNFPTPLKAAGGDDVLVGRIRPDPATAPEPDGRTRGWQLFLCGDQLRKGAALNAVQIAEELGALRGAPITPF